MMNEYKLTYSIVIEINKHEEITKEVQVTISAKNMEEAHEKAEKIISASEKSKGLPLMAQINDEWFLF